MDEPTKTAELTKTADRLKWLIILLVVLVLLLYTLTFGSFHRETNDLDKRLDKQQQEINRLQVQVNQLEHQITTTTKGP
jgi:cell division protein FtsL